jgi:hypothetical protein
VFPFLPVALFVVVLRCACLSVRACASSVSMQALVRLPVYAWGYACVRRITDGTRTDSRVSLCSVGLAVERMLQTQRPEGDRTCKSRWNSAIGRKCRMKLRTSAYCIGIRR